MDNLTTFRAIGEVETDETANSEHPAISRKLPRGKLDGAKQNTSCR